MSRPLEPLRALRPSEFAYASTVIISLSMPELLSASVACVAEHRCCGVLDGGVDGGYGWLQSSCGALIMQMKNEPPKLTSSGSSL